VGFRFDFTGGDFGILATEAATAGLSSPNSIRSRSRSLSSILLRGELSLIFGTTTKAAAVSAGREDAGVPTGEQVIGAGTMLLLALLLFYFCWTAAKAMGIAMQ